MVGHPSGWPFFLARYRRQTIHADARPAQKGRHSRAGKRATKHVDWRGTWQTSRSQRPSQRRSPRAARASPSGTATARRASRRRSTSASAARGEVKVADLEATPASKAGDGDRAGRVKKSGAVPIEICTLAITRACTLGPLLHRAYLRSWWKRSSTSWYSARFLRNAIVKTTVRTARIAR